MADDASNLTNPFEQAFTELAAAFKQFGVKHAVIGGVAFAFRVQARSTKDIDFILHIPQLVLPGLLEDLQRRGFEFDLMDTIREWTQHHMVVLSYKGIRIDWLKPVIPAYAHVLDRATEESWLEHSIRVASAEGLILLKLLAFRSQDQTDIENLIAAHRDTLDVEWIKTEWQTVTGLDDPRMQKFLEWVQSTRELTS